MASFLALIGALGTGGAYAANTIGSSDIIDNSILSADIHDKQVLNPDLGAHAVSSDKIKAGAVTAGAIATGGVGNDELADGAVTSAKVARDALTARNISGGESNGAISLGAGFVANGRCRDFNVAVNGAKMGDAVVFSVNGPVPQGILLYGVRVDQANNAVGKACNLSGTTFPQLTGVPVAIVTISPV